MVAIYTAVVDAEGKLDSGASTAVVPWWSFTKTLIAAAMLRLGERGVILLDEPLGCGPYTPRQLLQHRAGLDDYGRLAEYHEAVARGDDPWPEEALLQRVPPDVLVFAPGGGWAYSNVGYLLLRRLVEERSGSGLGEVLLELVLAPLGLQSARLAEAREDMKATAFAGGHGYHPGWVYHGTVIGPVAEAALALHRILHGDLLAPASRKAMLSRYGIGGRLPHRPWVTTGYGLGLMMGSVQRAGMAQPIQMAGHSAGGPGSVGAVYHGPGASGGRTAAVFTAGKDEGVAEHAALRHLAAS